MRIKGFFISILLCLFSVHSQGEVHVNSGSNAALAKVVQPSLPGPHDYRQGLGRSLRWNGGLFLNWDPTTLSPAASSTWRVRHYGSRRTEMVIELKSYLSSGIVISAPSSTDFRLFRSPSTISSFRFRGRTGVRFLSTTSGASVLVKTRVRSDFDRSSRGAQKKSYPKLI